MESSLSRCTAQAVRGWLAACAPALLPHFDRAQAESAGANRKVAVIDDADNVRYAASLLAAMVRGDEVWLDNPKWGESERQEARVIRETRSGGPEGEAPPGIFIPTGGTGGKVRFVGHDLATLSAAVSGFSTYAGNHLLKTGRPAKLHAVQALPCCHVSGLMPVVRAWLTGGEVVFADPSFRPENPLPEMPATADGITVVSLVPAQLYRLLERADGPAWLREAGLVLVGGSAVSPELLGRARREKIPLGVSYGLTEAAALAALYPPERFLAGDPVAGDVLPHLRAAITPEGRIALSGDSIARDMRDADGRYVTGDEGFLDGHGWLVVTGRADRIIVSGGEKIDPAEIEAAIRATGLVREVIVLGEPDPEWGRRLVAVYTGDSEPAALNAALESKLTHHRMPKRWVRTSEPLFDEKGKVRTGHLSQSLCRSF